MMKEHLNSIILGFIAIVAIIACMFISYQFYQFLNNGKDITKSKHPYNECLEIFIKESTKNGKECDFKQAKSVCFELLEKKN